MELAIIRNINASDFDQWNVLWQAYNEFYGRIDETALSEEITMNTWRHFLDPDSPVHCLVAEIEGQLAGLAHYIIHLNTIMIEPTCYLQDLYSNPNFRNQGIGRMLIERFYSKMNEAEISNVYWHTHSDNKTAKSLYDKIAINTEFIVYRKQL